MIQAKRIAVMSLVLILLFSNIPVGKVRASTFTVNTLDDHNDGVCDAVDCTLREALIAAQPAGTCDWGTQHIIRFSVSGVIRLDHTLGPLPDLRCPLILDGDVDGDGNADVRIVGRVGSNGVSHAFNVYAWDDLAFSPDVIVRNLELRAFEDYVIGLFVYGTPSGHVRLENVDVRNAPIGILVDPHVTGSITEIVDSHVSLGSDWGMRILARTGTITIRDTVVARSGTGTSGGGIEVQSVGDATVTLSDVTIRNNVIGLHIYANSMMSGSATVQVWNSGIYENSMQGILIHGDGRTITNVFIGTDASWTYRKNDIHDNGHQGILLFGSTEGVWMGYNDVFANGYEGIKLDGNSGTISGTQIRYGFILENGDVGIKLVGDVRDSLILGVRVGVDGSYNPRPNGDGPGPKGDGGIVLVDGPTDNVIQYCYVAYHHYHNILLKGERTNSNIVIENRIRNDPSVSPDGYQGILITDGADSNRVEGNIVSGHVAEGVVVYGSDTDGNEIVSNKVGAFDDSGAYTGDPVHRNGAGIAVINAAAPTDITFPFPVYALTPVGMLEGPTNTLLEMNEIRGNNGDGIIAVRARGLEVRDNLVADNVRHGIYLIGSEAAVEGNEFLRNGGSGVRVEPFYGDALAPLDGDDDHLSTIDPFIGNTIRDNSQHGLYVLDNPWEPLSDTVVANTLNGNSPADAAKAWLGYVRVVDMNGDPVTGLTVQVFRGGDDGDAVADYTSGSGDSAGRYGPTGFSYMDISTWWQIVEEEATGATVLSYNPHSFGSSSVTLSGSYSWDGIYPTPGETGGASESPPGSGTFRYQWALLRAPLGKGEVEREEARFRPCNVWARLEAHHEEPLEAGEEIRYVLSLRSDCDREVEVNATIPISEAVSLNEGGLSRTSGKVKVFRSNGDVEIRWIVRLEPGSREELGFEVELGEDTPLGTLISHRAIAECEATCRVIDGGSDDPATRQVHGDPTERVVSHLNLTLDPGESAVIPIDLRKLGGARVERGGCVGWELGFEGAPLGFEIGPVVGELEVASPSAAEEGCELRLMPRVRRYIPGLGDGILIELGLRRAINLTGYMTSNVVSVKPGDYVDVLVKVRNLGTVEANYTVRVNFSPLRLSGVTLAPGKLIQTSSGAVWKHWIPPGEQRSLRLVLIVPSEFSGIVRIDGTLEYYRADEKVEESLGGLTISVLSPESIPESTGFGFSTPSYEGQPEEVPASRNRTEAAGMGEDEGSVDTNAAWERTPSAAPNGEEQAQDGVGARPVGDRARPSGWALPFIFLLVIISVAVGLLLTLGREDRK